MVPRKLRDTTVWLSVLLAVVPAIEPWLHTWYHSVSLLRGDVLGTAHQHSSFGRRTCSQTVSLPLGHQKDGAEWGIVFCHSSTARSIAFHETAWLVSFLVGPDSGSHSPCSTACPFFRFHLIGKTGIVIASVVMLEPPGVFRALVQDFSHALVSVSYRYIRGPPA